MPSSSSPDPGGEDRLRIALTVDPEIPLNQTDYGGIERIVDMLAQGLVTRGHEVTVFAHPDLTTSGRLVPWPGRASGSQIDTASNAALLARHVFAGRFDIVHSFSRIAYLAPFLPLAISKLMTYQRHITYLFAATGTQTVAGHAVVHGGTPAT